MKQYLLKTWLMVLTLMMGVGTIWAEKATMATGTNASSAKVGDKDAIKVGTAKDGGSMTITVGAGATSLEFYAAAWNGDKGLSLNITPIVNVSPTSVSLTADTGISGYSPFTLSGTESSYKFTIALSGITKETKLTLKSSSSKRFVVWGATYTTNGGGTPTTYNVNCNTVTGGTISASPTTASEGATVSLTATPENGYTFTSWYVLDDEANEIAVTDNKFTMPASDVEVEAIFTAKPARPVNEVFYESFDSNNGTGGNDGLWNGTIASNALLTDNIWSTIVKGSGASACAKFGIGSELGYAITPAIHYTGTATLTFKAAAWNNKSESTILKLSVNVGSISSSQVTIKKGEWDTFQVTLTNTTQFNQTIKFEGYEISNSRFFLDEISVVKTDDVTPSKTATSLSWSSITATATIGVTNTFPTLTTTPENLSGVTYSSSNLSAATIDSSTGKINLVGAGETTITASYAGDDIYEAATDATYTLTVCPALKTTYSSLAELVADGEPTTEGRTVTVALTNEEITRIFTTAGGNRNGIFLQSGEQEVEVYCQDVPETWAVGGTVSGTLTSCTWKKYNSIWELCPENWNELTYAPRYTVVFAVNGVETTIREETVGAGVAVPIVDNIAPYTFTGWVTNEIIPENTTKPASKKTIAEMPYHPTANEKLYALYERIDLSFGEVAPTTYYTTAVLCYEYNDNTHGIAFNSAVLTSDKVKEAMEANKAATYIDVTSSRVTGEVIDATMNSLSGTNVVLITKVTDAQADNVIVKAEDDSYTCASLNLSDKKDFAPGVEFKATKVVYSRSNTQGNNTVCLPFAISGSEMAELFGEGSVVYALRGVETSDGYTTINFDELGEEDRVDAGTPCIVQCATSESWSMEISKAEGVDIRMDASSKEILPDGDDSTPILQGAFLGSSLGTGYYKLNSSGTKFVKTTASSTISPFRFYLEIQEDGASDVREFGLSFTDKDGHTTGIVPLKCMLDGESQVYDLSGRRMVRPTAHGIYIVKGKKVSK